jgi:hypothetical protein
MRSKRISEITEAYEAYELHHNSLGCEFCLEGPLECACEDVSMVLEEADLDEALSDTRRRFEVVAKLGRAKTEQILGELSLDADEAASWKTVESMAMWL